MNGKLLFFAGGAILTALIAFIAYMYISDPGRLTTKPSFSGLSRTASGNTLHSSADPTVEMTFDETFQYIGGQKFELYGTANVEQHFFVEETSDGDLQSFFWIQFESFLPDNSYTYNYSASPLRLNLDGFEFYTDTAPGRSSRFFRLGQPGTDGYLARKFAADKGYHTPDDYAYARLVNIPDDLSRKELLIIFIDDLKPTGYTGKQLQPGGEHEDRWAEVESEHLAKIKRVMSLASAQ